MVSVVYFLDKTKIFLIEMMVDKSDGPRMVQWPNGPTQGTGVIKDFGDMCDCTSIQHASMLSRMMCEVRKSMAYAPASYLLTGYTI